MMAASLAVEAQGLVKSFNGVRAVDQVSLSVPAGSICGVLGPNGAGKTTTINMLATLLKPDSGTARIFGHDVVKEAPQVRQLIGLTGQFATIDESLTARENLMMFGQLLGFSRREARRKADGLLEEFGLTQAANKALSKFSGGMRRRLDLACSLLSNPPLIFLDEPTTGLDPRTRAQMWQTIRNLVDNGSTVLLTTQYLDEADQLANRIVVIDKGQVVADDSPAQLKKSIASTSLQLTLKDPRLTFKTSRIVENILNQKSQVSEVADISVPLRQTELLTPVLAALADEHIELAGINVRQPTLDEVFFALTGSLAADSTAVRQSLPNNPTQDRKAS